LLLRGDGVAQWNTTSTPSNAGSKSYSKHMISGAKIFLSKIAVILSKPTVKILRTATENY